MDHILKFFKFFAGDETAASMIDYALIIALVSVAALIPLSAMGLSLAGFFESVSGEMTSIIASSFGS